MANKIKNIKKLYRLAEFNQNNVRQLVNTCRSKNILGTAINIIINLVFEFRWFSKSLSLIVLEFFSGRRQKSIFEESSIGILKTPASILELESHKKHVPLSNTRMVLFIANKKPPQCKPYRVDQKVKWLESEGFEVCLCWFSNNKEWSTLSKEIWSTLSFAQAVIIYRVPNYTNIKIIIAECKRLKIPIFYDIDDLVFDFEILKNHPYPKYFSKISRKMLLSVSFLFSDAIKDSDFTIASSKVMKHYLKKHNCKPSLILHNCLSEDLIEFSNYKPEFKSDGSTITICYPSGHPSHDIDFNMIAGALTKILRKYQNVVLLLIGHLKLPATLKPYQKQIRRIPFVEREAFYYLLSSVDINLAPLVDSVFNNAKNNNKFFESAILGIPILASPIDDYENVIRHGETGMICKTEDEWFQNLSKLIEDKNMRKQMGKNAREQVLSIYHPNNYRKKFVDFIIQEPAYSLISKESEFKTMIFINQSYDKKCKIFNKVQKLIRSINSKILYLSFFKSEALPDGATITTHYNGRHHIIINDNEADPKNEEIFEDDDRDQMFSKKGLFLEKIYMRIKPNFCILSSDLKNLFAILKHHDTHSIQYGIIFSETPQTYENLSAIGYNDLIFPREDNKKGTIDTILAKKAYYKLPNLDKINLLTKGVFLLAEDGFYPSSSLENFLNTPILPFSQIEKFVKSF